jgi:hypothetical protein
MMPDVRFADICDKITEMNAQQLRELAQRCEERIDERKQQFEILCNGFYNYQQDIQNEFPNAHVYLCQNGGPDFDVMDLIIPEQTFECCEIGD